MLRPSTADRSAGPRHQVLDAAAKAFRHNGYMASSLRDIAAAVGMKAGSLYYHFESKEDLAEEILRLGVATVYAAVREAIESLPKSASARRKIEVAIRTHLGSLLGHDDYSAANIKIFREVPHDVQRRHWVLREEYENYWRRLFLDAMEDGTLRHDLEEPTLRLLILGAMNWSLEWYKPGRKSIDRIARDFTDLFFRGASNSPERRKR